MSEAVALLDWVVDGPVASSRRAEGSAAHDATPADEFTGPGRQGAPYSQDVLLYHRNSGRLPAFSAPQRPSGVSEGARGGV